MGDVRAFVAILLPDEIRARLGAEARALGRVAADVAWVAEPNLHLTLRFLGQVDEARVPAIADALRSAAEVPAFDLALRGLGAFPTPARPRVLWVGAGPGAKAAAALAARVSAALDALGFPREERPFASHVTLGRVRTPRRNPALADALAQAGERDFGGLRVGAVSLMRSHLSPAGARYTELAALALG
ncbi:MAG: RNA 2',3'-cyclic phosphodiesterase [Candidatus Rokuibacteriota bacterium]